MKTIKNFWSLLTRGEKIVYGFLWSVGIIMIIQAVLSIYFYFFHDRPSVWWPNGTTFPIVQKVLKQGDPIQVNVVRCSKDAYSATISREIIDGIAYTIPATHVPFVKGCVGETRYIPEVTKVLPAGKYYVKSNIEVQERWLWFSRIDRYETMTDSFTIVVPRIDPEAAVTGK